MNDLSQTRQSLLLRLSEGSDDAWEEFLAVYEQAIFRYLLAKGLQDADARDATQDVLEAVLKRIDSWDHDPDRGSFRSWLFRVARNTAVDELAKRRRISASGDSRVLEMLQNVPQSHEAEFTAFRLEYRRALFQWAAAQIRPKVLETTWQSFWLTAVEGQAVEQVADQLNLSVGAVYTSKCRVVSRLRAKISEVDNRHSPTDDAPESLAILKCVTESLSENEAKQT